MKTVAREVASGASLVEKVDPAKPRDPDLSSSIIAFGAVTRDDTSDYAFGAGNRAAVSEYIGAPY